jgi:hypothetical protein
MSKKLDSLKECTDDAIKLLRDNLKAPVIPDVKMSKSYSKAHLLKQEDGWEPPHPDIVREYFCHFKENSDYKTDEKLAHLLGLSSNRRIREFSSGNRPVPFGVWRRFLVLTGRVVNDVAPTIFIAI